MFSLRIINQCHQLGLATSSSRRSLHRGCIVIHINTRHTSGSHTDYVKTMRVLVIAALSCAGMASAFQGPSPMALRRSNVGPSSINLRRTNVAGEHFPPRLLVTLSKGVSS